MAYFIFTKNSENIEGTIYKIGENESDLNNLNINKEHYKIIEDLQSNFDLVKYGNRYPLKYINNTVVYNTTEINFADHVITNKNGEQIIIKLAKEFLREYIENYKIKIKQFLDNNKNHPLFNRWNNYYNQINNLNLDSITYPLNKSLEQYFNDLGQPSYNILQLP
jgi:hypothetical protein